MQAMLFLIYRKENWDLEKWSQLPKVTPLRRVGTETWAQPDGPGASVLPCYSVPPPESLPSVPFAMRCPTNGLTFVTKEATLITPTKANEREECRKEREGLGRGGGRNSQKCWGESQWRLSWNHPWLEKADGVAAMNGPLRSSKSPPHERKIVVSWGCGPTQLCEAFAKMELRFIE